MKTPLLKSRRFWTAVLDAVVSLVSVVVSLQFSPEVQKLVLTIVATLQPVFMIVIAAFTVDDIVERLAQARVEEAKFWAKCDTEEDCCK
jgi:branched-subunit amino acid permease